MTAIKLLGLFLLISYANSDNNFLTFLVLKNNTLFFIPSNFEVEIIVFAPFFKALLINLLPSLMFPFIAKKI